VQGSHDVGHVNDNKEDVHARLGVGEIRCCHMLLRQRRHVRGPRRQLNGRVALVFFGFTNCPDVCPLAMAKMMQLQASRGAEREDIAYIMISVDGERDTPEVMKKFLAQYSLQFIGLTGDSQSIKPIAKEFSVAFFKGAGTVRNYDVSHSPQVFVMDQAGRLRAEFYNASIEAMTGVTQALIEEKSAAAN
jgi:protein SCO1/2